jgi:hypothetical protein
MTNDKFLELQTLVSKATGLREDIKRIDDLIFNCQRSIIHVSVGVNETSICMSASEESQLSAFLVGLLKDRKAGLVNSLEAL